MAAGLRCPWCNRWFRRLRFIQWTAEDGSPRHEIGCHECLEKPGRPWSGRPVPIREVVQ